jgi:hypothetical protein
MRRIFSIVIIALLGLAAFFYLGNLIYYSRVAVNTEEFTPSIVPVSHPSTFQWIPVMWASDTLSDRMAMFLPVYIDTIGKPFWMQFDLGTPITDLMNLSDRFPNLKRRESVLSKVMNHQNTPLNYADFPLRIGESLVYHAVDIPVYDQLRIDTLVETDSMYDTKIGNLGYDLIAGRILILDFIHSRIAVTDTLPEEYRKKIEYFDGGRLDRFPIYLPIEIDGSLRLMQYDNGSSAFTIWTSSDRWNAWRCSTCKVDTFTGSSWGEEEFYCRSIPGVPIEFMGKDVSASPIWMISGHDQKPEGILPAVKSFTDRHFGRTFPGSIGNEYFRNEVLVIDAKHNRFGRLANPRSALQ